LKLQGGNLLSNCITYKGVILLVEIKPEGFLLFKVQEDFSLYIVIMILVVLGYFTKLEKYFFNHTH